MAPEHSPRANARPLETRFRSPPGELARIRDLALRIPATRNELIGPTNSVIDALWDLEERLRFCYHLHCEKQRQFLRQAAAELSNRQKKPLDRQAEARPANASRRA